MTGVEAMDGRTGKLRPTDRPTDITSSDNHRPIAVAYMLFLKVLIFLSCINAYLFCAVLTVLNMGALGISVYMFLKKLLILSVQWEPGVYLFFRC